MIICAEDLKPLKHQFDTLINSPNGKDAVFDIMYRMIAECPPPHRGEKRSIPNQVSNKLFSEDPEQRSLWLRINLKIAEKQLKGEFEGSVQSLERTLNKMTDEQVDFLKQSLDMCDDCLFFKTVECQKNEIEDRQKKTV